MAAVVANKAVVSGAVKIACDPPVLVWGGRGNLTIGDDTYIGIGDRGLAQTSSATLGGSAQAVSLSLSRIEPTLLAMYDADDLQDAPAVLTRLIFDASGTQLLDHHVFTRGKIDQAPVEETPRGDATITATIEGAARTLGRRGGRLRSDADQRLVSATDGGLKHVSYAGQKTLYWGGQPPVNAGTGIGAFFAGYIKSRQAEG